MPISTTATRFLLAAFIALVAATLWLAVARSAGGAPPRSPEYDPSAEVTLRGQVTEIHESKLASDHPGLHLRLQTEDETVEIHACPVRFLKELEFTIEPGDSLVVVGSRPKGAATVVAREISKGQLKLILRDPKGVPNWTR
jgi:hypothetical protein